MNNNDILVKIKNSIIRLNHWEKLANQASDAWEAEPENIDREEAFNHAYELEFNEYVCLVDAISKLLGVDEKTAKILINKKRNEMLTILETAAM